MLSMRIFRICFVAVLLSVVPACSVSTSPAETTAPGSGLNPGARVIVVATTTQVTALAQVVGGERIALTGLLKANVDPHEYEPTPEDVRTLAVARVIFINGIGLEKWLDKVVANSGTKAPIIDTSKGVPIHKGDAEEPQGDPHIWFSAANDAIMLNNVRDGLIVADPVNASFYKTNAAAYEQKLNDLDKYIQLQVSLIPPENRKFVANHDAFGYFLDRYGLTFAGSIIPSMDTNFEPSAQDLGKLVDAIKSKHVKAIFTESSINPNLAHQIAQEAGVKVVDGALYGDTLGPPGSGAETLDGMLKFDADLIVSNLK